MDIKPPQAKPVGERVVEPNAEESTRALAEAFEQWSQLPEPSPGNPVMPDLTWPECGFYHTVDSALASLSRAGIASGRITIKKAGRGWQKSRVVGQHPPEGSPLTPDAAVEIQVEGDGLFYHLPTGMRDGRKEGVLSAEELTSLFDDATEKSAYYVRQGGLYFDISPDNNAGCARWIRLFGINHEDWSNQSRYKLALILPHLQRLAGREDGLRLVLKVLLDLELREINWQPNQTLLADDELSLFGKQASRLGTDLIVGDRVEDEAMMEITIGPVSLLTFQEHQEESEQRVHQVLRLVLPYHLVYTVRWLVGDTNLAPRLGIIQENSVLGINTHLGHG